MIRFSSALALLLAGIVVVMSGVPSMSAPKSAVSGETDSCEICKHCPPPTSKCAAACMDCYIRSVGPAQLAPSAPPPGQTGQQGPLPAQKAK